MRHISYILIIFTLTAVLISCNKAQIEQKPNIILIMADDMGVECLSTYGSTSYKTPRLDQMAKEGLKVNHCIANPLCTPSRVKIMTGLHNYRNYEYFGYLNPNQYTFGNMMKEAGYATCIVGKWQLNGIYHDLPGNQDLSRPYGFGFNEYCLWQVHKGKNKGERFANPLIIQNGRELERDPDAYGPDIFANYAMDFIERKKDSAFLLYYPMVLVHDPFVPTPDSKAWSEPDRRYEKDTAYFKDMVAYTDKIVGKLLDKLEEEGLAENTLIIFTGDNGTHRNIVSHTKERAIKGAKGMTIDAGVHVPLIMHWPARLKNGFEYDGVIEFSDFFATFAEIAGAERKNDGSSFLTLFEGDGKEVSPTRDFAFVYYDPMWGNWVNAYRNEFVQNERFKLYRNGDMYDIEKDFHEETPILTEDSKQIVKDVENISKQEIESLHNEMRKILDQAPPLPDVPGK